MFELVKSVFLIVDAITIAYCVVIIYKFDKYCDYQEEEIKRLRDKLENVRIRDK